MQARLTQKQVIAIYRKTATVYDEWQQAKKENLKFFYPSGIKRSKKLRLEFIELQTQLVELNKDPEYSEYLTIAKMIIG